ncbi:Golgi transport complex subunit 5-domain-containing protein [Gamsiella multidivaricata]|uniref:Golgi transport complex subunit 5-domain-containing protein n=1 Tax=Gamsiella multidivaricata TaxID=101098 RepID=UPI00221EA7B5|nr:Golgi transport complex subunit 5-domain-containing protein [Gamsiella multidivaricata]KAG0356673.1 Conserved oligomeric Golgi complex subunit [Gamsiella multidivaricata]KAI7818338.1 Golgi transport complex subunit 5-domain-containing protein [Gamsiella multidivaricata]
MTMATAIPELDSYTDYDSFLVDQFDPNTHANSIIHQSAKGELDIATSLSSLSFSIDSLNKQLHDQVTTHYNDLLSQAAGIRELETVLETVKLGLRTLTAFMDRLSFKIKTPFEQIQTYTIQLERLQVTSEVLRRVLRFLYLSKRLEMQMPGGDLELTKAALTLSEVDALLQESDLEGIHVVDNEIKNLETVRGRIVDSADRMLQEGMDAQNQAQVGSALQVFYSLKRLDLKIVAMTSLLSNRLHSQIKQAVDIQSLQKEAKGMSNTTGFVGGGVRRNNGEPSVGAAALWTSILWKRMEKLMDEMYNGCIKIYLLERVLARKRDPLTQISFLEIASNSMDGNMVHRFWQSLSVHLEQELKAAARSSQFLHQAFIDGFPRLLNLLHEFFSRVSVHNASSVSEDVQSPEVVLMLRAIASFESAYKTKTAQRSSHR